MRFINAIAAALAAAVLAPGIAETIPGHDSAMSGQAAAMTEQGQVQTIDAEHGTITLKHAAGHSMPAMTMVYRVADAAILARVKVGDAVRFRTAGDNATITQLKAVH